MPHLLFRPATLALGCASALAACDTPQNAVTTTAGGATQVQIQAGQNCFDNKCFRYDPSRDTINVSGRRDIRPPAGVPLASGRISPAEFRATFDRGMMAGTIGGSER